MFYEMLSSFEYDTFSELPDDIQYIFSKINISEIIKNNCDNNMDTLDYMWEKTKEICGKYINSEWLNNLGIQSEILLDDIKAHCIFSIYLSIINKNIEGKTIEQCIDNYYEFVDRSEDPYKVEKDFKVDLRKWIDLIANSEHSNGFFCSELYYYLNEGLQIADYDDCLVFIDPKIFYQLINTWNKCPYAINNSGGITFKNLYQFRNNFVKIINSSSCMLDKYAKEFIVERLFNISFLSNLVNYVNEEYITNTEKYTECVESYKQEINKKYDEKYVRLLLKNHESIVKENYNMYKRASANKLLFLSEIVSIPMVFSRNKYIDMINASYEANIKDVNWQLKFRCSLYYLNSYLIPLLLRLYYLMIFYRYSKEKDKHSYIKNLLEEYIKINSPKYNYKNFELADESLLKNGLGAEALQINATEIIFNFNNHRNKFNYGKAD